MRRSYVVALGLLLAGLSAQRIGAQTPGSSKRVYQDAPPDEHAYRPPDKKVPAKTPDGQPNLQGIWSQTGSYTPLQRPVNLGMKAFYTPAEAEELYKKITEEIYQADPGLHYKFTQFGTDRWQSGIATNLRTSIITDPPDGRLPALTDEAKKRNNGGSMRNFPELSLHTRCVTGYWTGGGPMLNLGIHFVDLCRVLLNGAALKVTGAMMGNRAWGLTIEDHAVLMMQGGGASCMVEIGRAHV